MIKTLYRRGAGNISRIRYSLMVILNHPLSRGRKLDLIKRYISFHLSRRFSKKPIIYPFIDGVRYYVPEDMTGIVRNYYTGLEDFEDMGFLLQFLRKDDLFVDVGANVGVYTLLASGACKAKTISIEPIPSAYEQLLRNLQLNNMSHLVTPLNCGAGSSRSVLRFTSEYGPMNRVARSEPQPEEQVEADVLPLDDIIGQENPHLLKIDVEGFEVEVIKGAVRTLQKESLSAIIIEINSLGNRYGFKDDMIHDLLVDKGFSAYEYDPFTRELIPQKEYEIQKLNTLFIRNRTRVQDRLDQAVKRTLFGKSF
jgi:FkbM family methyltransferase